MIRFGFICVLFLTFGVQTSFAASVSHDCVADSTLDLGVDYNTGDDLTLTTGGTCALTIDQDETAADAYVSLNSLTIDNGVTLTHAISDTTADHHNELDLVVTNAVTINGTIDVSEKGYIDGSGARGYTDGNVNTAGSNYYSGGSHGGRGGKYTTWDVAESYDSISNPSKPGGGGAGNAGGGNGGGVVRITSTSGTITVNGDILADGEDVIDGWTSGGAGGTVYLNAATEIILQSGKTISANGGDVTTVLSDSAGGGGRIAFVYPSGQFTDNGGTITAYGGTGSTSGSSDGSAGTIHYQNGSVKDVYVDAGSRAEMYYATEMTSVYDDTFTNIYLSNSARFWVKSDATSFLTTKLQIPTGTYFESDLDFDSGDGYSIDITSIYLNGGTAKFDGLLELSSMDTTNGDETGMIITNGTTYIANGAVVIGDSLTWEANSDTIKTDAGNNLSSLTIKDNGTLTTSDATPLVEYDIEMTVGALTVDNLGEINVDGKGYLGGQRSAPYYNAGVYINADDVCGDSECDYNDSTYGRTNGNTITGGSFSYAGASHGGSGGTGDTGHAIADNYGSITSPTAQGGGGGGSATSADGGGVIRISATTMTINGDVTANGETPGAGARGAGAGGSIYLNASTSISLDTGNVISANGGDSGGVNGGSGGGGRVAVIYPSSGFTNNGTVRAYGGYGATADYDGTAGTVFLHDTSNTYGDLLITNCGANCSAPYMHTSLLTTIPAADQVVDYNNGYAFNSLTTADYGILNIPSAIETPTRKFHCNTCTPADDDSAVNGEIVYDTAAFSGGLASDYTCVGTNATPTVSINSVAQKTDGSGEVDISIDLSDADTADTLTAKVEYSAGAGCAGGNDPTLDTNDVTGTEGTPSADNAQAYQVRSVLVTGGTNTVTFDWLSATDVASADGTYCIKVTPNDGTTDGTPATQTYTADNADPSGLTALTATSHTTVSMILGWAAATETNFAHYEIWYGLVQGDVQGRSGTAVEWDDSDDADLATKTTTDTTITGLTPNLGNYFKIWAIDTFGNAETVSDIQAYTTANTPGAPTVAANATDGLDVIIDENSNPSTTEYAIKVGSLYVQADGILGVSEVWQTYTIWGGATGVNVTGLSVNTQYAVSVKARNGDNDETSLSTVTSKYTFANPVTNVSLVGNSTTTTYGMILYWTDANQPGIKIDLAEASGSICDSTYDVSEYDNSGANPNSPRSMGASGDICHKVRIGSYNSEGALNTADYAYSNDLTVSLTVTSGSSGTASFFTRLSGRSSSDDKSDESDDTFDEDVIVEEKEEKVEEKVFEPILERIVMEDEYVKEPIKIYELVERVYDLFDYESKELSPEFRSVEEYFADEEEKKELLEDVLEEFADEFLEDFVEEVEEAEAELEADVEVDIAEVLEEFTAEEIVASGITEIVEISITNSVREAVQVEGEVEIHTDKGVYVVDDADDVLKILEDFDDIELEKMDLDNDGISDAYAMSKGIPLFNPDPDGDGISTEDELFCGWDPVSADLLSDNLANTEVTNLKGMTAGNVPAIRACGEEGSVVDVVLFDVEEVFGSGKFASEEELTERLMEGISLAEQNYAGSMVMDEANRGVLLPSEEIEDGKYIMMLSDEDGIEHISTLTVENDKVSAPARVEIGSRGLELGFVTENIIHLIEKSVSEFDADLYIGSFPGASMPVVYGEVEDFESLTVVVTWRSRILSSTVLTDATQGDFELKIPDDLPPGAHEVVVYLQDEDEGLVSSATALSFIK